VDENKQEMSGKETTFNQILRAMNESGQFSASFLVDEEGMSVATACDGEYTEAASAMAAQLREMVEQTQQRIHLGGAEEMAVRSNDRTRLVSRCCRFGAEGLDHQGEPCIHQRTRHAA